MITARKSVFLEWLFIKLLRGVIRRRFFGVFVHGLERVARLDPARPVIVCANHTNWWDGFIAALFIPQVQPRRVYLAQYEKLLAQYRPLRCFGVFGLDREGAALPGLRYALRLLSEPNTAIWIFPQGVLVPQWQPIEVKSGALWLAQRSGAQLLPVVFRYEWLVESRPSIFVSCGETLAPEARQPELGATMQSLYDGIGPTLFPFDPSAYNSLVRPRMSMNKWWQVVSSPSTWGRKRFNPRNE